MARTSIKDFLPTATQKAERLDALRSLMREKAINAWLIPRTDEWQNEYIPAFAERLAWLSGFTGSAGFAIVSDTDAAIFVDGRYVIQVAQQIDADLMPPQQIENVKPHVWLAARLSTGMTIGCDPWLHTPAELDLFRNMAATKGAELVFADTNLIDLLWTDQPAIPAGPVTGHAMAYAGQSSADKRQAIGKSLAEKNQDSLILTRPDSIAWAFNIRGEDVACTPLALSRAIIHRDGTADLYLAEDRLDSAAQAAIGDGVSLQDPVEFERAIECLTNKAVWVDPSEAPAAVTEAAKRGKVSLHQSANPCLLMKARKNKTEIEGSRQAHIRDGAAIAKFLHWFDEHAPSETLTELSAAAKLYEYRQETGCLKDLSFPSISAAGPHSAIPHYGPDEDSNLTIKMDEIYLIDSGGQYEDGTTDITRTMIVGTPTDEMKDRFTRVLKGHIALAMARFPRKTAGHHLDTLARLPLWQAGLDFDHGTGHGVGAYLGVHEGPQRIAKAGSSVPLEVGMICSNEPGYYKEGAFGIRIENLIVTQSMPTPTDERDMLGFETVTFAPIDQRLIDGSLLSNEERQWLDNYHQEVLEKIGPHLEGETRKWLTQACQPLA